MYKNARSVKWSVLYNPTTNNFLKCFSEYLQKFSWFVGGSVPPPPEQRISLSLSVVIMKQKCTIGEVLLQMYFQVLECA